MYCKKKEAKNNEKPFAVNYGDSGETCEINVLISTTSAVAVAELSCVRPFLSVLREQQMLSIQIVHLPFAYSIRSLDRIWHK